MRILFLGNNWLGLQSLRWLRSRGEDIVGVVLHPTGKRKHGAELVEAAAIDSKHIFDGSQLRDERVVNCIKELKPDIGVSILFGYILREPFLQMFPEGCINLHTSLLPYNRGAHPNVWSIVEGTPAGATLHFVDPGVDTGDIIAQRRVAVEPIDTALTLYAKLEQAGLELFKEQWPLISLGQFHRTPQSPETGTSHRVIDLASLDQIQLDHSYTARKLLDIIRARTFPPHRGAFFIEGGKKVYLRLELEYGEEDQK